MKKYRIIETLGGWRFYAQKRNKRFFWFYWKTIKETMSREAAEDAVRVDSSKPYYFDEDGKRL
jgi:hypothetical protein